MEEYIKRLEAFANPDAEMIKKMVENPVYNAGKIYDKDRQAAYDKCMSAGTVLVGVKAKDGAILVTDQKASLGGWGAVRDEEKIKVINKRFAMSITGAASMGILMGEILNQYINMWEEQYEEPATIKTVTQFYRNISMNSGGLPLVSLLVGVDEIGPHLVEVYGSDGYFKNEDFATNGSGSVFAKPLLENGYDPNMKAVEYKVRDKIRAKNVDQLGEYKKIMKRRVAAGTIDDKQMEDDFMKIKRKIEGANKVTLPRDGLTLALAAAAYSSIEDNANDPSILTDPPYHVVIARKDGGSQGLEIYDPKEVTERYRLIIEKARSHRTQVVKAPNMFNIEQFLRN